MVVLAQSGPKWVYLSGLVILAFGTGFSSGNNLGLLKNVSTNLRKDTANLTALAEFVIFISSIVGAWIGSISYELALYISAGVMFSANIPLLFLPKDGKRKIDDPSLYIIIKDGFTALKNPILAQLFLILAVFGGFFFSTKSIIGSFANLYDFNLKLVGLFVGLSAFSRAIGSKLYAHYQQIPKLFLLILITATIFVSAISSVQIIITMILLFHLTAGYLFSTMDGDIHELVSDHIRSSIFSMKRLVMRLMSSIFLFAYGLFVENNKFSLLMFCLGLTMVVTVILTLSFSTYQKNKKGITTRPRIIPV
jgi:hypothetical protein